MIVFLWDGPLAATEHGYARQVAVANQDWTGGDLHFYGLIRSMPVSHSHRLQFAAWQYNWTYASISRHAGLGEVGTPVTWWVSVDSMSGTVDWTMPRQAYGVMIQNELGKNVTDYSGQNWNGENPDEWYPLDLFFAAYWVPPGETFPGWEVILEEELQEWVRYSLPPTCMIETGIENGNLSLAILGVGESQLPSTALDFSLRIQRDESGNVTVTQI
jgi:hypothetical protein